MITEIIKDVTDVTEGIVAHGCNCSGGFGSGVAGAIKRKWPQVFTLFKSCGAGKSLLGTVCLVEITTSPPLYVANCYTQLKYGNDGKQYADLSAVQKCLETVAFQANRMDLPLYIPKIGCGLGGLSWEEDVLPVVEKVSCDFPNVNINVCTL